MSQPWVANLYTAGTVADTTLSNMELMFATLKSAFSGVSAPSSAVAGQVWYDTAKKLMKHRNQANSAWRGVLAGTSALKLWLYLNAAQEGWALDASTGADDVLAIKGGSAAYNVNGGTHNVGSWTISGVSVNSHTLITSEMPAHSHGINHDQLAGIGSLPNSFAANQGIADQIATVTDSIGGGGGHNHNLTIGSTWRPDAAVGRLFYPDV